MQDAEHALVAAREMGSSRCAASRDSTLFQGLQAAPLPARSRTSSQTLSLLARTHSAPGSVPDQGEQRGARKAQRRPQPAAAARAALRLPPLPSAAWLTSAVGTATHPLTQILRAAFMPRSHG